jgi:hypothetical protein
MLFNLEEKMIQRKILKRYTDIPALIYLLQKREITLLDPASWDDKNDIFFMEQYKTRKTLKSLLALCFTQASETFHHWKVFANGSSGVCITFKRSELLNLLSEQTEIRHKKVDYKKLNQIKEFLIADEDLPFCKRHGYLDEGEYRVIYENANDAQSIKNISINLSCIEKITFSPFIPQPLFEAMKEIITKIPGCEKLKLYRSTLVNNLNWQSSIA